jgi:hypothetical protein
MTKQHEPRQWVLHNSNTDTYDTPDGTQVAACLVDNVGCLADILHVASIRERQRAAKATGETK